MGEAGAEEPPRCDADVWEVGDAAAGAPSGGAALALAGRFVREHVAMDRPLLLRGLLRDPAVLGTWRRRRVLSRGGDLRQVMQYRGDGSLAEAHTWRRVALRRWVGAEMRGPPPKWPEYIFDQSADAGGATRAQMLRLFRFPWRALLHAAPHALYVGRQRLGQPVPLPPADVERRGWRGGSERDGSIARGTPPSTPGPGRGAAARQGARTRDASGGALQCEQRPGDVLFVPKLWGHCTLNLGETVGVATAARRRGGVDYGARRRVAYVS